MITIEQIQEKSLKSDLQAWWKQAEVAAKGDDPTIAANAAAAMRERRHPDTIVGFLTKEAADAMIKNILTGDDSGSSLLSMSGLTVISDKQVLFLTDDSGFGHGAIPKSFFAIAHSIPLCTTRTVFENVDAFLNHYYPGEKHLGSLQELVDYINAPLS